MLGGNTTKLYHCRICRAQLTPQQALLYDQTCTHWRCQHERRTQLAQAKHEAERRQRELRMQSARRRRG